MSPQGSTSWVSGPADRATFLPVPASASFAMRTPAATTSAALYSEARRTLGPFAPKVFASMICAPAST